MRKIKIIFVLTVLIIFELVMTFYLVTTYKKGIDGGHITSVTDYFIKRNLYLALTPMILGLTGLFIKSKIGWIFTSTVFYLMTILGVAAVIFVGFKSAYDILTYLVFMIFMISPLLLMNDNDFKIFYKIDNGDRLVKENIISFGAMVLCGTLLVLLNNQTQIL